MIQLTSLRESLVWDQIVLDIRNRSRGERPKTRGPHISIPLYFGYGDLHPNYAEIDKGGQEIQISLGM